MHILDRLHWIDQQALTRFILYCQVNTGCCREGKSERMTSWNDKLKE